MGNFDFVLANGLFRKSLGDQKRVLEDFWDRAATMLSGSEISLKPLPESWLELRHNYFSVLFIAVLRTLGVPKERLWLYARLNHCLRTWVTACDNLLDDELKELILTDLPEQAHVFKSVHTLLTADRIFFSFALDAHERGDITAQELRQLISLSLDAITVSGIEEAREEGGVDYDIPPEEFLEKVHIPKTGHLFISPLMAPGKLEGLDGRDDFEAARKGLLHFGLGCQILDDLSDLGMDAYQRKHNYLGALIAHGDDTAEREALATLMLDDNAAEVKDDTELYRRFPLALQSARVTVTQQFTLAADGLTAAGLPFGGALRGAFLAALMELFEKPDMLLNLRGQSD
jgi:hypothetical protein